MTKYLLTKPHFIRPPAALAQGDDIDGSERLLPEGTIVEWGDARPSLGMAAIDSAGAAKCAERDAERRRQRDEAMKAGLSHTLAHHLVPD